MRTDWGWNMLCWAAPVNGSRRRRQFFHPPSTRADQQPFAIPPTRRANPAGGVHRFSQACRCSSRWWWVKFSEMGGKLHSFGWAQQMNLVVSKHQKPWCSKIHFCKPVERANVRRVVCGRCVNDILVRWELVESMGKHVLPIEYVSKYPLRF